MVNLREQAEADLATTLEGEYALPVQLTTPDGQVLSVTGQVVYETLEQNPETGMPVTANNPLVTLRRSSLSRVPQPSEKWFVRIPTSPSRTAELEEFIIDANKPPTGGRSIGTITLHLRKVAQLT